jgi:hypothetical protein
MEKYYILAIGGSGALASESLVHLCAAGYIESKQIDIIVVDPDQTNENVSRLQQTVLNYNNIRSRIQQRESVFFSSKINYIQTWNPNSKNNNNLENGISYVELNTPENLKYKILTNLLFSPDKRKELLDKGYKGNPMIGTIFMKDIEKEQFFKNMSNEEELNVFVFGSLFGGTGAAGLPVMGKSLRKLRSEKGKQTSIGACIVLPYFGIKAPEQKDIDEFKQNSVKLLPESGNFLPAVKFAIPFYIDRDVNKENGYDSIYFIGCPKSYVQSQRHFQIGGRSQKNRSHYINLYAASAFLDFIKEKAKIDSENNNTSFYATSIDFKDDNSNYLTYENLPDVLKEKDNRLIETFYISAIYNLKYFQHEGKNQKFTWFYHEKRGLNLTESFFSDDFYGYYKQYCEKFLIWLGQLRTNILSLEIFNTDYYKYDEEEDVESFNINSFKEDLIGGYRLHSENSKKSFFSSKITLSSLNDYYLRACDEIEKNDDYQKFLDTLYKGSLKFIQEKYQKKN